MLACNNGGFQADILISMTLGKYSADVVVTLELMPLFKAALLNAGGLEVSMSDRGRNCACSSLVGSIGPRGPA